MLTKELIEEVVKEVDSGNPKILVLYNDEIHSFDYVIDTLIDICKHTHEQAEQCALLTHHNGKCEIKQGMYSFLKPIKELLIDKELIVSIEG